MLNRLLARLDREEGQTLVEYALILTLIAFVSAFLLLAIGDKLDAFFTTVGSQL